MGICVVALSKAYFQSSSGGGGIEREIKAKFYFHLKKIFFSVPTRMSVVLSRSAFCWAKRAIKPVQGRTGLITASKNRRCFLIVHGWNHSKMYFLVHFWITSFSVEKLAFAQHPLTSCQYTGLTFRQTCVQALYSGRTTLDRGFPLQSLSGILPSLVLFVPHRRP